MSKGTSTEVQLALLRVELRRLLPREVQATAPCAPDAPGEEQGRHVPDDKLVAAVRTMLDDLRGALAEAEAERDLLRRELTERVAKVAGMPLAEVVRLNRSVSPPGYDEDFDGPEDHGPKCACVLCESDRLDSEGDR